VGTEVWRYVAHVSRGELKEAYQVIREANPFPSVCARVCGHPCEVACRCGTTGGDPIAVRALKRFVVDQVEPCALEVTPAAPDGKRVAVVGAGPSGLTAAHILSSRGFLVTVFERESEPGGMLCTGIPGYRLPREVIRKEIASLANVNWEIRCNVALGRDFTIDSLLSSGYSAVYLATGAYRSQRLGVPGEDVAGVLLGMHFLKAHNLRGEHLARGRVGVVGGGNAALDAARVALRQPAVEKVTILYRRDRADMPAFPEEIEAALEEGVELVTLVAPVEMLENDHHLSGVRLVRNRLATPDASSRRRPVPIAGSEFELALDTLIVAISEDSEVIVGAPQGPQGRLQASTESCATARPGVFGGGDLVRGPSGVVHAIADGKRAALMIERYLTGRQMRMIGNAQLPAVFIEPPESTDDAVVPRACVETVPAIVRRSSFAEVDLGLTAESAACEARRCLRCDLDFTRPVGK
jgi:NADH-quinone oxidoreductase subunit F